MSPQIKLVSLNIEYYKHLDTVLPFLKSRAADVICLQEILERDLERFRSELKRPFIFAKTSDIPIDDPQHKGDLIMGDAIFSSLPIIKSGVEYYAMHSYDARSDVPEMLYPLANRALTLCDVDTGGSVFRICTTHCTWTPNGKPNDVQRQDVRKLLSMLESKGEFVLCGDFNAPRGGEVFARLAEKYKDNIPAHYKTSLDPSLHRSGKTHPEELMDKMVDGIFSTPGYTVSNVEMVCGVSDHCALVATVSKT